MLKFIRFIGFLILLTIISNATAKDNPTQEEASLHSAWQALLIKHVVAINNATSTQVDYAGFKADQAQLRSYLNTLSQVSQAEFNAWPKSKQLAFLINAYNAWTIELILTRYPKIDSIKELGSFFSSPWSKEFIPLLGEKRSLDNIEHTLIRGSDTYKEPRIHFAVNCASIGCPALRGEAYNATHLDAQLEEQTTRFLADTTRNYIKENKLHLSSIFKWYKEDFEQGFKGAHSLSEFILLYSDALNLTNNQIAKIKANKVAIKFLDYDWALNDIQ